MIFSVNYENWLDTTAKLLAASDFLDVVKDDKPVLLKPNLVNCDPPPITTPVELVEEIVKYIRKNRPGQEIIIGEGTGETAYDTFKPFKELGYTTMAEKYGVELIDLNQAPLVRLEDNSCSQWPEMFLPEIIFNSYLVSIPQLKAHSLAMVTLSMKNLLGVCPPSHYNAGSWNKSAFHRNMQLAILELNKYRKPDYAVMDATVGMAEAHLWGPTCNPPVGRLLCSADPVALDACGAELLGFDWREISHIKDADGILGKADFKLLNL